MVSLLQERLDSTRKQLQSLESGRDDANFQLQLATDELQALKLEKGHNKKKLDDVRVLQQAFIDQ